MEIIQWFHRILINAKEINASDIHLSSGSPIMARINGEIVRLSNTPVKSEYLQKVKKELLKGQNIEKITKDYDIPYEIENFSRFRINIFKQRKGIGLAIRIVDSKAPNINDLEIPSQIKDLVRRKNGLFLVTGPTGSGKSTTLASIIEFINQNDKKHIITLEDPIEYVFENKLSLVQQRQLGHHFSSFEQGIRSALRQDPDIILIGELRDKETISAAISAAETGHLVLGTLHTKSASKTIDRIIDTFSSEQQNQVRSQLASLLLGVLSQQLVTKKDKSGRQLVTEFMVNNNSIANLIREDKTYQINNVIQTSSLQGMYTLQSVVERLIEEGVIPENHGLL